MPLALIFSSRLLLTEKSSVNENEFSSAICAEILSFRATLVTPITPGNSGHRHGGIND